MHRVGNAGQETGQIGERQLASIAAVEEAVYERAAELVAELPIAPARVIGSVDEELRVRVDTSPRHRRVGAQGGPARPLNQRQARVVRTLDRIQSDRSRGGALVLRLERLWY